MEKNKLLRKLPKIDELLDHEVVKVELADTMRILVMNSLRESIDFYRNLILQEKIEDFSEEEILEKFKRIVDKKKESNFKGLINATGVIIHTNLGRSLLCENALKNVINVSSSYSNLEYNLESGTRGSRYKHVEEIIKRVTGAESSLVVNNNAAAVLLVLNTMCNGKEAVVSRGQLVEIGGSFRIPEVMKFSGSIIVEVGTTNRTHIQDYENAINENTGVFMKVHTSNFKVIGFSAEVSSEDLSELAAEKGIPVIEDIGSGTLIDFSKYGFSHEPTVQESIKSGIDVVTFSGDKMLGGPQAGIIVGKKKYIDKMKKNQLLRALRVDKMTLAALEATLNYYVDEKEAVRNIPTLYMMLSSSENQKSRAQILKEKLEQRVPDFKFTVDSDYSMVGGGSMPEEKIPTYVIRTRSNRISPEEVDRKLRRADIPVIVRIANDEVVMDLRTILDKDFDTLVNEFADL
ncbi:L-seryl-tRNA(Sec) selenium transferase [Clostridium sp. WLY-B-L2]|uniref:L-seryl-tRNA(Sec) selenium transferase n=1 Tax=Clostridium aromativorans TaxID=2836848 RepID=A0ABS8N2Z4_9CLOT|nr:MULTISPECIES: L-seryl-tRNA(Sec) selenium transferase [Clostridium]KAA8673331.1 L-seryl-tRNA(Sec) selenium transferase [Clostridium sp. HV4-5-A1G]MCC9294167.1 L-seryl-tRNA(Sec) selenium transferase [Clostridium aromativorans]CAB1240151.1 selenocysteine synthase [Clostridiaceae bacterium BL-3]